MSKKHPEETALLAAIASAPDDHLPRLVFADWLEERNDPRAAWVRDTDIWEWMKPDAHDPMPGILESLPVFGRRYSRNPRVEEATRSRAEVALDKLGPADIDAAREWLRTHPDHWPATPVQEFVAAHPPTKLRSVRTLRAKLKEAVWVEVWLAVIDLGFHGPASAPAVTALTKINGWDRWVELCDAVERYELPVENAICRTLGRIGPGARKAVPWLAEHMWMYEESAAEALIQLRADPDLIVDHINTDEDCEVESGIHNILELADDPVAFLVRNARRHTGRVAYTSLWLLAEMGAKASAALPALRELSQTRSEWDAEYVQAAAARAIRAIQGTP